MPSRLCGGRLEYWGELRTVLGKSGARRGADLPTHLI